jgi:oxygen-independent coproporphyrinogen-3 oxidase
MTPADIFDAALVSRYDTRGPRYTSYPTADRFHPGFGAGEHQRALRTRAAAPLSLYLHIPFCPSPCFYCGCHREITRQPGHIRHYLDSLAQEIALKAAMLENPEPVVQVHFGGGSPTFLTTEQLAQVVSVLRAHFRFAPTVEMSIEADPRNLDAMDLGTLSNIGFNRISIGVQDFDPVVQSAINRHQSYAQTEQIIKSARRAGFDSVSLDLIYGLPYQEPERFDVTLNQVVELNPDRVALYSYAHLPGRFKAQRRIPVDALPHPDAKLRLLAQAVARLTTADYRHIGMDHFAKPHDSLAIALLEGRLHRNFQGYSTLGGCDLIGLGVSAISQIGSCYAQNTKDLKDYTACLNQRDLPIRRGIALTREDLLRQDVIQQLMCQGRVAYDDIRARHGIDFSAYFTDELRALGSAAADGLVRITTKALEVTPQGRYLLRAVAFPFDAYLNRNQTTTSHSRLI